MTKPQNIKFDFSDLKSDKNFQEFLNQSLENEADEIDLNKCLEGIEWFYQTIPFEKARA